MTTETAWAELRERIRIDRAEYNDQASDHEDMDGASHADSAERCWGRVAQCDDMLAAMDRLEAGQ
jgi:hypothetical protein